MPSSLRPLLACAAVLLCLGAARAVSGPAQGGLEACLIAWEGANWAGLAKWRKRRAPACPRPARRHPRRPPVPGHVPAAGMAGAGAEPEPSSMPLGGGSRVPGGGAERTTVDRTSTTPSIPEPPDSPSSAPPPPWPHPLQAPGAYGECEAPPEGQVRAGRGSTVAAVTVGETTRTYTCGKEGYKSATTLYNTDDVKKIEGAEAVGELQAASPDAPPSHTHTRGASLPVPADTCSQPASQLATAGSRLRLHSLGSRVHASRFPAFVCFTSV